MNRLKELRKEKGLTQTDLAELLEVTKLTIHNWENGVFSIKSDRLKKLCEIFDVDAPYLLGYNNVKNETDIIIYTAYQNYRKNPKDSYNWIEYYVITDFEIVESQEQKTANALDEFRDNLYNIETENEEFDLGF